MASTTALSLVALTLFFGQFAFQVAEGWEQGRATFYGNEPWWWSIHHGSCGKGYLWPDQGTGWDVAALSDTYKEYAGSCGRCYEVKCEDNGFKDGYGAWIDRKGKCRVKDASVVVTVTDTCPCQYANNYYSNKRWCCGDMNHFDLSVWAFQKLADMKWGVISVKYRKVDCGHKPWKQAWGASFPGEYPPRSIAKQRSADWYWKHFSDGGYLSAKLDNIGSKKVSTHEFLKIAGVGGGSQYGK